MQSNAASLCLRETGLHHPMRRYRPMHTTSSRRHRKIPIHALPLRDIPHAVTDLAERLTPEFHLPRSPGNEIETGLDERAFTRPVRADNRDQTVRRRVVVHIPQHGLAVIRDRHRVDGKRALRRMLGTRNQARFIGIRGMDELAHIRPLPTKTR